MAIVIVAQIHEAALRDDLKRVEDLLPWLENAMVNICGDALNMLQECYSTLQLAVQNAPIDEFPDWVKDFYPCEVEPTSRLWSEGKPPKVISNGVVLECTETGSWVRSKDHPKFQLEEN